MKIAQISFLLLLLAGSLFYGLRTYQLEREEIQLKNELIELSKIKYGLFNVDEWKKILAGIITKKVNEFSLEETNREAMRAKISNFLTVAINDFEKRYYKKKSKSLLGMLQGGVAAATGAFDKIKEDIPVFTEQILDFLNEKENREAIGDYMIQKLNEYADETFSETDYSLIAKISNKYGQVDHASTKEHLIMLLSGVTSKNKNNKVALTIFAILAIVSLLLFRNISSTLFILFILTSLIFLALGLLLPMIEIDARISNMRFTILEEEVTFSDQVLYYKSKSILEVVQLMVIQSRVDLLVVGVLVLSFSVIFPLSKLICSVIYLLNPASRPNKIISFLVMKSGKWSMADVMVVAIFMAYLGFEGILSEQLKQIENLSQNIDLITTNNSNLLFGFYMFTAFVLLSLFSSTSIQAAIRDK